MACNPEKLEKSLNGDLMELPILHDGILNNGYLNLIFTHDKASSPNLNFPPLWLCAFRHLIMRYDVAGEVS